MISVNRFLIFVLVFTVFFSVFSISFVLLQYSPPIVEFTGFGTQDNGEVNLTIINFIGIDVQPSNATLNYGACTTGNISGFIRLDNNISDAILDGPNCTEDGEMGQWITLVNTGNLDVNVSVMSECSSEEMIGGTIPQLNYTTNGCSSGDVVWQEFSNNTQTLVCSNLTTIGAAEFNFSTGAVIPSDAIGGTGPCNDSRNLLTFFISQPI